MIQIIGLRPFLDKKTNKEKLKHELFTTVESVPKLFETLDTVVESIPEHERWNVYFTALNCLDPRTVKGQLRRFESQEIFPFDIDGIDQTRQEEYIKAFFEITGLDAAKTAVICSGNGLQFFAQFDKPFTQPEYFDQKRFQYKTICERLDKLLAERGLPGRGDPSVWTPARIMRLANTENRKKGKDPKRAFVIQKVLKPQVIDWERMSKVSDVKEDEHIPWDDVRAPKLDHKEMFKGCAFLKSTLDDPGSIREPHYYASLSILARMDNGRERAHLLQQAIQESGSDSTVCAYTHQDVEKKIDQALQASGPRTCKSINAIWGKCSGCDNFGKVVSPVSLKGAEHIATKDSGFYTWTKDGKPKPNYVDLLKYFDQIHTHRTLAASGLVFVWDGKKYNLWSTYELENFAYEHFNPKPSVSMTAEFSKRVRITNLVNAEFFGSDLSGFINFQNGILNAKTKELLPHTPDLGFRHVLPYAYDPSAKADRFDKFLDEVTGEDRELRLVLEEFGGYALSGDDYWSHHCLLLIGEGRNGKSKFIEALQMAAGDDNYSTTKLEKFSNQNDLQLMEGKLFNVSEEISHKEMRLTEALKDLSSGNMMTVKLMYNQPYKIKNKAKLILTANKLPETTDMSFAFFERMIIVPFEQRFVGEKKDPFLAAKFKAELPGIFNILFKGYERLLKAKSFTHSHKIDDEKAEYAMDNNPLAPWWEDRLAKGAIIEKPLNGKQDFTFTADLFSDFCFWNQIHGNVERIARNKFTYLLMALLGDGKARRDKLRHTLRSGTRGDTMEQPRWGFYDVVYNSDKAQ